MHAGNKNAGNDVYVRLSAAVFLHRMGNQNLIIRLAPLRKISTKEKSQIKQLTSAVHTRIHFW
jgi:hypothetical protein